MKIKFFTSWMNFSNILTIGNNGKLNKLKLES